MLECEALRIQGDIRFESSVAVKGQVRLTNSGRDQKVIRAGSILSADVTF